MTYDLNVTIDPNYVRPAPPPAGAITTTPGTLMDFGSGKTLTLSATAPLFQWEDGSWGVVTTDGAPEISADTPASAPAAVDGYVAHGMVKDPAIVDLFSDPQGLDEIASAASGVTDTSFKTVYDNSLNLAPSRTGSNLQLAAQGGSGVAIKAVRKDPLGTSGPNYINKCLLDDVMVVSAVPAAPLEGAIRPPMVGGTESLVNINDIDYSRVRTFTLPPAGMTSLANCLAYMAAPQLPWVAEGEYRRALSTGTGGINDYTRDIIKNYVVPALIYMVHPSTSTGDRDTLARAFLVRATDVVGAYNAGVVQFSAAGQTGADHVILAAVAALCPTKTIFTTVSRASYSNLNDASRFLDASVVGLAGLNQYIPGAGSASVLNSSPPLPENVGFPYFMAGSTHVQANLSTSASGFPTARYRDVSANATASSLMLLGLIEGGWEAIFGPQATWDNTNDTFATIGILDQQVAMFGTPYDIAAANFMKGYIADIWVAHRATMPHGGTPVPITAQPPVQISFDMVSHGLITATASGVDIDYGAVTDSNFVDGGAGGDYTGSHQPITAYEWIASHDGKQWGAPVNVGPTGSIAFTGTQWLAERRTNASGPCPYSPNLPYFNGLTAPYRNIVPGGTIPVGAPVNTEAPKILDYRYPQGSNYPLYDPITGAWPADRTTMFVGAGLWADGVDSISYQWRVAEDGGAPADISGATSDTFVRTNAVMSTGSISRVVHCDITVDDGNGNGTTISSNALTMPVLETVEELYTVDPGADVTPTGGTTVVHVTGAVEIQFDTGNFSGAEFAFNGSNSLIAGAGYSFELEMSEENTAGTIETVVVDADGNIISAGSNQLAGPGVMTATATALTAEGTAIRLRRRGIAQTWETVQVTRATAIPV